MVRRYRHVPGWHQPDVGLQGYAHAPFVVDVHDLAARGLTKLELEVVAAARRSPHRVPGFLPLEHDAFTLRLEDRVVEAPLVFPRVGGFHDADARAWLRRQQRAEFVKPFGEPLTHVYQVEAVQDVTHKLTVQREVAFDVLEEILHVVRHLDLRASAVVAAQFPSLALQHEPHAVDLLLHRPVLAVEHPVRRLRVDRVEQDALARDGRFGPGHGRYRLTSVLHELVSLAGFLLEELVEYLGGGVQADRIGRLGAGRKRVAAPAVREVDDVAAVDILDRSVVDLVARAFLEVKAG